MSGRNLPLVIAAFLLLLQLLLHSTAVAALDVSYRPGNSDSSASSFKALGEGCQPVSSLAATRVVDTSLSKFDYSIDLAIASDVSCIPSIAGVRLKIDMPHEDVHLKLVSSTLSCSALTSSTHLTCDFDDDDHALYVSLPLSVLSPGSLRVAVTFETAAVVPAPFQLIFDVVDDNGVSLAVADYVVDVADMGLNHVDESSATKLQIYHTLNGIFSIPVSFEQTQHIDPYKSSFALTGAEYDISECIALIPGKDAEGNHVLFRYDTIQDSTSPFITITDTPKGYATAPAALFKHAVITCSGGPTPGTVLSLTFAVAPYTHVAMGTVVVPTRFGMSGESSYLRTGFEVTVPVGAPVKRMSLLNHRIVNAARIFFNGSVNEGTVAEPYPIYYHFDYTTMHAVLRVPTSSSGTIAFSIRAALDSHLFEKVVAPALIIEIYNNLLAEEETVQVTNVSVLAAAFDTMSYGCEPSASDPDGACQWQPCSSAYVVEPVCLLGALSVPARECAHLPIPSPTRDDEGCVTEIDNVGFRMQVVDDSTLDLFINFKSSSGRVDAFPLNFKLSFSEGFVTEAVKESVVAEVFAVDGSSGAETEEGLAQLLSVTSATSMLSFRFSDHRLATRRVRITNYDSREFAKQIYKSTHHYISRAGENIPTHYYSSASLIGGMGSSALKAVSLSFPINARTNPIVGAAVRFSSDWTMGRGCSAVLVPYDTVTRSTTLFPTWPAFSVRTVPAADERDFTLIPLAITPEVNSYIHVRCEGTWGPTTTGRMGDTTLALIDADGFMYSPTTFNPIRLDFAYGTFLSTHYFTITADPSTTLTPADVAPLLPSLVPDWLEEDGFKLTSVPVDDTDPTSRIDAIVLTLNYESVAFFPYYFGTLVGVFKNVLGLDLAPIIGDPLMTHSFGFVNGIPRGSWVCADPGTSDLEWLKAGSCAVVNNCGYVFEHSERRCSISGTTLPSDSYEAQRSCAFAPLPVLPVTWGCGAMLCPNSEGDYVPCDAPSQCIDGCAANVTITQDMIGTVPAFAAVCVKDNKEVDASMCFHDSPVYASTCDAVSSCGAICSTQDGQRVSCDDDGAWSSCSEECGEGEQHLQVHCGLVGSATDAPGEAVPDEFCGWVGTMPNHTRSCIGTVCPTHAFLCRADDLDEWGTCDDNAGFGSCSVPCGAGVRTRKVGCALFSPDGDLIGTPNAEDLADCADITPVPSATTPCDAGACPPNRWECLAAGSTTPEPCDNVPFPACPTDGCFEPEPVSRTVGCYSGLTGELLDNDACSDAGLSPDTTEECPLVTVNCTVDFPVESPCHDASGTEHTCLVPGTDPATVTRAGVCIDSYDTGAVVPDAWCPELPMDATCDDLPACPAHAARWVETVAAKCYAGADATCRSYRPVTAACEVQFSDGGEWQAGGASDCSSLPAPKTEVPCEDMPSCGAHGECISTSPSDNTGVCKCSDNYTGSFCEEEPSEEPLLVTLKAAAEPGSYIIEWSAPTFIPANAIAQVSLVLHTDPASNEELVVPVATTDASDRTVTFTAMGLVKAGDYFARVIIADEYSGESTPLTIAPGCLADVSASCLNGGSCMPETGECECSNGYSGSFCEEEPSEEPLLVTLKAAAEPGTYTIEWSIPSFIPANAIAQVSLVHTDLVSVVPIVTTDASDRTVTFTAKGLVQAGVYFARVIVADEYSGESSPVAIAPGCLAGDSASCLNGGTCAPETGVCECSLGYSGPVCEEEPTEIVVTLTAEADEPGSYTIEWAVPSFIPVNATALVSLVLHSDPAVGGGLVVHIATTEASDRSVTVAALGLVQADDYIARVILADEYLGESPPVAIAPGCLAGGSASCRNGGSCTPETGVCVCAGEWTGPTCSISPCASSKCNPHGGTCSVSPAGDAVCTCATGADGAPLFTGPNCLTPVDGCTATLPTCAHGGVRTGALTDPSSGQVTCGECACENQWTPVSDCADCGLVCINGGARDSDCSKCTCKAQSGFHGETCSCRHIRMNFIVLSESLPFTARDAVTPDERMRLLSIFGNSFAADIVYVTKVGAVTVESVREMVSSKGVHYVRLNFLVSSHCPSTHNTAVPDTDLLPSYNSILELKSILDDTFAVAALSTNPDIAPALTRMHVPSGFSAHDPNCLLSGGVCPSGWHNNGVLPGETDETGGEEGGEEGGVEAKKSGLSTGAIVGIAVGSAAGLIIIAITILYASGVLGGGAATSGAASASSVEMTSV